MKKKADTRYYVIVGGAEHVDFFTDNARYAGEQWFWSVPSTARVGDRAFVYLTAPASRICGVVDVLAAPFYNVAMFENPKTHNRWMAEIGNVVNLVERDLTIANLRRLFHDWRWLFYPRGNAQIPPEIVRPLLRLARVK